MLAERIGKIILVPIISAIKALGPEVGHHGNSYEDLLMNLPFYRGLVHVYGKREALLDELDGIHEALFVLVRKELF